MQKKKWNSRKTCLPCYMKCPCRINVLWTMLLVVLSYLNFKKFLYIRVIHWKVHVTKVLCFHMFHVLVLSKCSVVSCMLLDHSPLLFTSTLLCTLSLSLYILGCNVFLSPWRLPNHWKRRYSSSRNYVLSMDCGNCRMRALLSVFFQMNIVPTSWENFSSLDNLPF